MALTLTLYQFNKRLNSTAAPTTPGVAVECVLKEDTNLLNPSFIINWTQQPTENYALFNGRYYWISNITALNNKHWQLDCKVDVLATYKTSIGATRAFVAYAGVANTEISDKRMSLKTTTTRQVNVSEGRWDIITPTQADMAVVLNVVGDAATSTYVTSLNNAKNLLNTVSTWSDSIFEDITSITSLAEFGELCREFFKKLISCGSAADCIKSACILPVQNNLITGVSQEIVLGEFPTGMQGRVLTNRSLSDAIGVRIPWQATDWRRNAPYHSIMVYIPFIGVVSLPPSELIDSEGIYIAIGIDVTNGDSCIKVSTDSVGDHIIAVYNTNISLNYLIGAANVAPMQRITAGGVASMVMASAGGALGAVAGASGLLGELNAMQPLPSSVGNVGGGAMLGLGYDSFKIRCMSIFHDTIVEPGNMRWVCGEPYMRTALISNVGHGIYIETRSASVSNDRAYSEELQELNKLLDSGIYYE